MKHRWAYIIKDDWCKLQEKFLKEKLDTGCLELFNPSTRTNLSLPVGAYNFIPSSSGLRPILIVRYVHK